MPASGGYSAHLASDAVAFVVASSKSEQRKILDLADRLAEHPFNVGDYQSTDASGRMIETLLADRYLFTFWVDHAAKEVRITEIVRV